MDFKRFLWLPVACLALHFHSPSPVQAEADLKELSLSIARDYMVPAYEALGQKAQKQSDLWREYCAAPSQDTEDLIAAFHTLTDSWQQVQHIAFGPITSLLRRDRLYHWPERRNAVNRALAKLLQSRDLSKLSPDQFASTSVAVQGLPALERLLFDPAYDIKDPYSCQLALAISNNIATIATGSAHDWAQGEMGVIPHLLADKPHPLYYESLEEIGNRLFTQFLTGFQMITDQKLMLPLGTSLDSAKPKRAEFWRSTRSVRNIIQSAKGLHRMGDVLAVTLAEEEAATVRAKLAAYVALSETLPADLTQAVVNANERQILEEFSAQTKAVRAELIQIFTEKAGLSVGFNSLDGD